MRSVIISDMSRECLHSPFVTSLLARSFIYACLAALVFLFEEGSGKAHDRSVVFRNETDDRYMNAAKYGLDKVYFGGCFIRGKFQLEVQGALRLTPRSRRDDLDAILCYPILE